MRRGSRQKSIVMVFFTAIILSMSGSVHRSARFRVSGSSASGRPSCGSRSAAHSPPRSPARNCTDYSATAPARRRSPAHACAGGPGSWITPRLDNVVVKKKSPVTRYAVRISRVFHCSGTYRSQRIVRCAAETLRSSSSRVVFARSWACRSFANSAFEGKTDAFIPSAANQEKLRTESLGNIRRRSTGTCS